MPPLPHYNLYFPGPTPAPGQPLLTGLEMLFALLLQDIGEGIFFLSLFAAAAGERERERELTFQRPGIRSGLILCPVIA